MSRLRINEIFYSLQGETKTVGLPTVFVRLTGCPLRCTYCDSDYAFYQGEWLDVEQILQQVAQYRPQWVTVTGGEPLAQPDVLPLMVALIEQGYQVSLETSGALDISGVDPRVTRIMDLKTPSSGEMHRNRYDNLLHLRPEDSLKFVIGSKADYDWARTMLDLYQLPGRCEILYSPVAGEQSPRALAEWILRDRLPVRFQLQLHKLLWDDAAGH